VIFTRTSELPFWSSTDYSSFTLNIDPEQAQTVSVILREVLRDKGRLARMRSSLSYFQRAFDWQGGSGIAHALITTLQVRSDNLHAMRTYDRKGQAACSENETDGWTCNTLASNRVVP
jgi:hypothetical protein